MKNKKVAIVSANFRKEVTDVMEKASVDVLLEHGLSKENINVINVPGSLEIPLVVHKLAKTGKYDAIITFGAILKGDTYHFEQVADECVRGCMNASWKYEIPVIYEVLAVYDMQHANDRAEIKGKEGALTALTMIKLLSKIS